MHSDQSVTRTRAVWWLCTRSKIMMVLRGSVVNAFNLECITFNNSFSDSCRYRCDWESCNLSNLLWSDPGYLSDGSVTENTDLPHFFSSDPYRLTQWPLRCYCISLALVWKIQVQFRTLDLSHHHSERLELPTEAEVALGLAEEVNLWPSR